jgi:methylmalonyl-CoA mutase
LAKVGDPVRAKARAGFCLSFLGAGGYDVFEPVATQPLPDAVRDAQTRGADFLVLCSSDEEYAAMVPEAVASGLRVLVAGNPPDSEALRSAGVKEFLHLKSDIVQTLGRLHAMLGIGEETV